jgi:hypothetical protein
MVSNLALRVSSTLDKSTPRKSLVDRDPGTCWTSTQGLPQWVQLAFPSESPIYPKHLYLTFQGGFAATRVAVYTAKDLLRDSEWTLLTYVYPEDVNRKQKFSLIVHSYEGETRAQAEDAGETNGVVNEAAVEHPVAQIKLVFEQSSDFFGRITIYDLDIHNTVNP